MMQAGIAGVAVWGPGMPDWETACALLRADDPVPDLLPPAPPAPACLPANERRRSSPVVRLALHVADRAVAQSGLDPAGLRAVFASSNGDGGLVHGILEALAADADISPTAFHNSVHNAAAGYWGIAHQAQAEATAISAYDDSFAIGLLKAMAELTADAAPVLLCAYDLPLPLPLHAKRALDFPFGAALVLTQGAGTLGRIDMQYAAKETSATACGNPAARALPVLRAMARQQPASLVLPCQHGTLQLHYTPC